MTHASLKRILSVLLPALVAGCGTPAAKDFGGRWKPVNHFQSSPTEIPLHRPYTYYAAPIDETLRNMLIRWTTDTGMTLIYLVPSDYTLFAPVARVHTSNLALAANQLSAIYAAQGVSVTVANGSIKVARAGRLGSSITPSRKKTSSQAPAYTRSPSPVAASGVH